MLQQLLLYFNRNHSSNNSLHHSHVRSHQQQQINLQHSSPRSQHQQQISLQRNLFQSHNPNRNSNSNHSNRVSQPHSTLAPPPGSTSSVLSVESVLFPTRTMCILITSTITASTVSQWSALKYWTNRTSPHVLTATNCSSVVSYMPPQSAAYSPTSNHQSSPPLGKQR